MPRKTDKRDRLIEAAKTLIHQQGFNLTTLADIAQEADVPLGNVYYYFKTKEAIGITVIEKRSADFQASVAKWANLDEPSDRLFAYIQYCLEDIEITARYGCSVGGLCQELGKKGGQLADLAANLLHDTLVWFEEQFKALGIADKAQEYSLSLLSSIQGIYLLAHTFKDPKIATRQSQILEAWLASVLAKATIKSDQVFAMTG